MYSISIICPTYNCEKYLKRTIDSVINQSIGFENLELILVDDCSTDSTKSIIKDYSKKYDNIKSFFSEENHGFPGFGRNIGISIAEGKYLMFIDNDDEYEPDYCKKMYELIESNNVECVSSNFYIIAKNNVSNVDWYSDILNDTNINSKFNESFDLIVSLDKFNYFEDTEVWSKIFKKEIVQKNNVTFIDDGLNEDTLFLFNYYEYANTILYTNFYGYKWYRDGDNLSYVNTKTILNFISSFYSLANFTKKSEYDIDLNKLFEIHIERIFILCLNVSKRTDLKKILTKLYEFETSINFKGKLKYPWNNIINKFVLRNNITISILLLTCMIKIRNIFIKK